MLSKSRQIACIFVALIIPGIVNAADCKTILAKLPKHSPETNPQAQMIVDFEKRCKERQDVTDAESFKQCVTVGMRGMAVAGNYVAAEKMAVIECQAGNEAISNSWMSMVINNLNASQVERDIAQEAINNNTQ